MQKRSEESDQSIIDVVQASTVGAYSDGRAYTSTPTGIGLFVYMYTRTTDCTRVLVGAT